MFPSYLEVEKLVPSYFEPDKHFSYLEREKRGSLLFGDQKMSLTNSVAAICSETKSGSLLFGDKKMQLTTGRSKEKDYDIYLKSEKLVHSQQEHEKNVSQLFGSGKNWFLAISSLTNTFAAI